MSKSLFDYLRRNYLFQELSAAELEPLAAVSSLKRYSPGEHLFCFEDEAEYTYLLVSGQVAVYRWTPEGEEKIFHTLRQGQLVAEAAMFMCHGRYPMYARADEVTEAYAIPRNALQRICLAKPEVAVKLLETLGLRLFSLVNRVDQLSTSSAGRRLVAWMADRCKQQSLPVALPINRQQLAVQLGIAPETLSRLLNKYRAAGLISGQRGQFLVEDLNGLLSLEDLPP
jgi:CRP-like cAMP-binding protein